MTKRERANLLKGLAFTSPWILGIIAFTLYPTIMSFVYSFSDYSLLNDPVSVGFQNYKDMFTDEVFHKALANTVLFSVMSLPFGLVTALVLALLLNQKMVARPVFRTIFFIPSLVPLVALAILWKFILSGDGAINMVLEVFGVQGPNWIGTPEWAKPALVLTGLWGCGQATVIYLAGLQEVPRDYYDAARVDGANWYQQIWHITLPLISPVIYFNVIMGCIGTLQVFAVPFIMTGGGPMRSTLFYAMYLFDQAFRYLNMGYACALAVVLFAIIAALTYTAHVITSKHVHYGGA